MKTGNKFCSIIMTHFAADEVRSSVLRKSITSLIKNTKYPYELVVIDNGGSVTDSQFLLALSDKGEISTYVKNSHNMHFAYARNQGLELAQGDYISIVDNDLEYKSGWLTECVHILEEFPQKKWYATPLDYPTPVMKKRYTMELIRHGGEKYILSMRAGSNCFVMRREDFKKIGKFLIHRISGSKWTDKAVRSGYLAVVVPGNLVRDIGLRMGYNLAENLPVYLDVKHDEKIYFNRDEFLDDKPELVHQFPKSFS